MPIPVWVKAALDQWTRAAGVTEGKIFRAVARLGKVWGSGLSQNVVWYVVRTCCEKAGLEHIARTISGEPVRSCVTTAVESWNRFSFCWGTHPYKRQSTTSVANKILDIR